MSRKTLRNKNQMVDVDRSSRCELNRAIRLNTAKEIRLGNIKDGEKNARVPWFNRKTYRAFYRGK